jgi:hypothetical protein
MLKRFPYVEDYIEIINGDRNPDTGKLYGLFDNTPAVIKLARYDVSIIASMSHATQEAKSLTDRQAELACKLVLKYRKQLTAIGIDVAPVETPKYRLGTRTIDRRLIAELDDTVIVLRFPYDVKLIDSVRELSKLSQGKWSFDGASKSWRIAATETNIIAAVGFARNNQFEINPELLALEQTVLDCEATLYEIKLVHANNAYTIQNAANSLIDYINDWVGFDSNNLDQLVDNSGILGYTVDNSIEQDLVDRHGVQVYNLMISRETRYMPPAADLVLENIVQYATITSRWPIYVYEPDLSDRLYDKFVATYFKAEEVHRIRDIKTIPDSSARVIFFHKYNPTWTADIPLLISSAGIMHGAEKTMLLQRAKKVVYFAADVYNSNKSHGT